MTKQCKGIENCFMKGMEQTLMTLQVLDIVLGIGILVCSTTFPLINKVNSYKERRKKTNSYGGPSIPSIKPAFHTCLISHNDG